MLLIIRLFDMNMIRLFVLSTLTVALQLGMGRAQAPAGEATVTSTPFGLYIELNDVNLAKQGYRVLRADGNTGGVQPIAAVHTLQNSSELHQRMVATAALFPDNYLPHIRLADTIWQIWHGADAQGLLAARMPVIQVALGVSFLDTTAQIGQVYRYLLEPFEGKKKSMQTAQVIHELPIPRFSPFESTKVDPGESHPELEWRSLLDNAAPTVDLWRRVSGTASAFQRMKIALGVMANGTGDSVAYVLKDTSALPGIRYDYYLTGRDALGNSGTASDTVSLQVGGRRNIMAAFNMRTQAVDNGIRLYWEPLEQNYALQNIVILRSDVYDGGYELLATVPVADTSYVDHAIIGGKSYYYQLLVQGESNFSLASPRTSGIYHGVVRLLPPQQVEGARLDKGAALNWIYPDTSKVRGFYVYRTFSTTTPLQQVSELIPVNNGIYQYVDTNSTTSSTNAYYAVAAVSRTQSLSPLSEIVNIHLETADEAFRVPAPSQVRPLWLSDTVVSITWSDLHQTSPGIAAYQVFRKEREEDDFGAAYLSETEMNERIDTVPAGRDYWYAIKTVDMNGKTSAYSPIVHVASQYQRPLPPGRVRLYKQDNGVVISWDGNGGSIAKYHIYRAMNEGQSKRIGTVDPAEQVQYVDKDIKKNGIYYYYVSAVDRNDIESETSEEIAVKVSK